MNFLLLSEQDPAAVVLHLQRFNYLELTTHRVISQHSALSMLQEGAANKLDMTQ